MAFIKLNGEQYELKFSYLSLLAIEKHYKKGVFKVFSETDLNNLETLTAFVWACLRKEKKFKNKDVDDIAVLIDDAIENEDITLESLAQAIEEAFNDSVILKNAIEKGKQEGGKEEGKA